LNPVATIVLPVHNAERTLRMDVARILELSETTARRLHVVVVDDGSTDGTFEAACELARQFPQVAVLRQPHQGGLRPALDAVRRRLRVEQVIAHNGIGPVDLEELAALLAAPMGAPAPAARQPLAGALDGERGSRRFGAISQLHARMAAAHSSVSAFRWLRLDEPIVPRRKPLAPLAGAPSR
jgi:hypothetical protein